MYLNNTKPLAQRLSCLVNAGRLVLFILILFNYCSAYALNETAVSSKHVVTGLVKDEKGETLIGVNIVVKGAETTGTVTDIDGRFSLSVDLPAVLVFSYLGYDTQEVELKNNSPLVIQLKPATEFLDEVVVVAYGAQKKVSVTGSIASLDNKDLLKSSSTNVASVLSGRLPGLTVMQSSGEPGRENINLFLRGAATMNGMNPLILVDGIPYDNISNIDPHEIANISILKDASATAVFGVRGANGVILITTQRGKEGSVKVSTSLEYSTQGFAFKPERIDSWDYAMLRNEALMNEGAAPFAEFSKEDIALFESWKTGEPADPYWHPNQNWQKILFKSHAPIMKGNINLSGGNNKVQYFISSGYVTQGGIFNTESKKFLGYKPQSSLDRYNFRSNIDFRFNQKVKAFVNIASSVEKINSPNSGISDIFVASLTHRPTSPGPLSSMDYKVQIPGGELVDSKPSRIVGDPLDPLKSAYGLLNRAGYVNETRSSVNSVTGLDINLDFITPGLSSKAQVSFNGRARSTMRGNRRYIRYKYLKNKAGEQVYVLDDGDDDSEGPLSLSKGVSSGYFVNLQWQMNYARVFNEKHKVSGLLLAQRDYKEASEDDPYTDKYLPFNVIGFSARGTYSYDDRYLAEVNLGYNGSEQFSPNKRFGFFPALSGGWVISNEKFLRNNKTLTNLKLRASLGKVGNDKIGYNRFLYLDDINTNGWVNDDVRVLYIPSLGMGGKIEERALGNPDITWEVAEKQNYAIDLGLFNDFSLTFDYFTENRSQILIQRGIVPDLQGRPQHTLPKVNMGKVENKGFELVLGYKKWLSNDFGFNANLNLGYNKNRVTEADEPYLPEDYAHRQRLTGYTLGQNWGYQIDYTVDEAKGKDGSGFFNSEEAIKDSGLNYEIGTPKPGDFIYVDQNGDNVINDRDIVPIKYSSLVPKYIYGANFGLTYKGFDFSFLVQGIGKYSRYYADAGIFEELSAKSYFDMHMNRWSAERYQQKLNGEKVNISHPRLANTQSTSHVPNDYYIMDASYVRLKNMEIGYSLPKKTSGLINAESIRFYINGDNLYTWHNLKTDGFDPEQAGPTQYPNMRVYNIGLNVTF